MSQQNVDVATAAITTINEAFRDEDIGPWARFVEAAFEAEVVLEARDGAFTDGDWRGRSGVTEFVAGPMEALEVMWIRADEVIDVDDHLVVVLTTFGGNARYSGIEFENSIANVLDMHDGRVRSWRVHQSREQALESIGRAA